MAAGRALKLLLGVSFVVALASITLLALSVEGELRLDPVEVYTRPVLLILSVGLFVLSLTGIVSYLILNFRQSARRRRTIAQLDHLSKEELSYVAESLRRGSPSIYADANSRPIALLIGKGLVSTPGIHHHRYHYPFSFHYSVWRELLKRKDEFIAKDVAQKKHTEQRAERWGRSRRRVVR